MIPMRPPRRPKTNQPPTPHHSPSASDFREAANRINEANGPADAAPRRPRPANGPSDGFNGGQGARTRRTRANTGDSRRAPVYDTSNGYPKGLPDGPVGEVMVGGVRRLIHGVPWEQLNEDLRKDLDEHPLDSAGQIRIFVPDKMRGPGFFTEFGSAKQAEEFRNGLHERGDRLL